MTSQLARKAAKSAGSQAHIAKIEVKSGSDGFVIVDVRGDWQRTQIGRQVLDLRKLRNGVGPTDSYGTISWGGLRFWPAETRSRLVAGSGKVVALTGCRCGVGFWVF